MRIANAPCRPNPIALVCLCLVFVCGLAPGLARAQQDRRLYRVPVTGYAQLAALVEAGMHRCRRPGLHPLSRRRGGGEPPLLGGATGPASGRLVRVRAGLSGLSAAARQESPPLEQVGRFSPGQALGCRLRASGRGVPPGRSLLDRPRLDRTLGYSSNPLGPRFPCSGRKRRSETRRSRPWSTGSRSTRCTSGWRTWSPSGPPLRHRRRSGRSGLPRSALPLPRLRGGRHPRLQQLV